VVGEEVEFMTIILWDSIAAVRALTGEDYERAVIPDERKKYLQRFEQQAAHFEVWWRSGRRTVKPPAERG